MASSPPTALPSLPAHRALPATALPAVALTAPLAPRHRAPSLATLPFLTLGSALWGIAQEPSKKAILRVTAAQDALMEGSGDSKVSDSKYEI